MPTNQTYNNPGEVFRPGGLRLRIIKLLVFIGGRWLSLLEYGRCADPQYTVVNLTDRPNRIMSLAIRYAQTRQKHPFLFREKERFWLRKSVGYLEARWEARTADPALRTIDRAFSLKDDPDAKVALIGCLIARDASISKVARALAYDPLVVEVFAVLFFNLRSRRRKRILEAVGRVLYMPRGADGRRALPPREHEIIQAGLNGSITDVVAILAAPETAAPDLAPTSMSARV